MKIYIFFNYTQQKNSAAERFSLSHAKRGCRIALKTVNSLFSINKKSVSFLMCETDFLLHLYRAKRKNHNLSVVL